MSGANAFFDTHVILYLFSADAGKANRAEELVASGGQISVQVLNELANVARRKLGFSWPEVIDITTQVQVMCPVTTFTVETHARGLETARRYGLSVYDAMIVAAALLSGCATLFTENMQDGQIIDCQLAIRNPFRSC
ncbi:MAG: PIN domain-containing protein [Casimicrobiaceae bacterium]